jgi:hypothetical protein
MASGDGGDDSAKMAASTPPKSGGRFNRRKPGIRLATVNSALERCGIGFPSRKSEALRSLRLD